MATVRIKRRPTGLINGRDWPAVGETIDLPDAVAEGMVRAGAVEVVEGKEPEKATSRKDPEKRDDARRRRGRPATPPAEKPAGDAGDE